MTTSRGVVVCVSVAVSLVAVSGCSARTQGAGTTGASAPTATSTPAPGRSTGSAPSTGAHTPPPAPAHRPAATGSPTAVSTPGPSTASTSPAGAGGACTSAQLRLALQPGSPGAGQRYATIVLTNTAAAACTVKGYGGVGLVDASGAPLATHQVRVSAPPAAVVTLAPGASASSELHFSAVPGTGDAPSGDCQPTATSLQVIPPDETHPLSVAWGQGPVCEQGRLEQQAYRAGSGA